MVILEIYLFKYLKYSFDVWYKFKKLVFLLVEYVRKLVFKVLFYWIKLIVNYFWWCCNICNGRVDRLLKRWVGIFYYVNNNYVLFGGRYEIYYMVLYRFMYGMKLFILIILYL